MYNTFIKWKQRQSRFISRGFTNSEHKFAVYLINLAESDAEFKKMLIETGYKTNVFDQVHSFYKDHKEHEQLT